MFERSCTPRRKPNMTPMIDMVFLLVVFFMLTSTFAQRERVDLGASSQASQPPLTPPHTIAITVTQTGALLLDNQEVSEKKFPDKLRILLLRHPNNEIFIDSNQGAQVQHLLHTIDLINIAGGKNFVFATENIPESNGRAAP